MFINCVQYCLLFIKCTTFIQLYLFFPFLTYVNVLKSVSELNSQLIRTHDAYKIVVLHNNTTNFLRLSFSLLAPTACPN